MRNRRHFLTALLTLVLLVCAFRLTPAAEKSDPTAILAELISPQKLATLGTRGANPRVQKAVYWMEMARRDRKDMVKVVSAAVKSAGYKNALAAELTRDSLLRNHKIAEGYRCFDAAGLAEMRKGNAPTIQRGTYKGDQWSVDHIVPRAVCPELDNVIANLELMPFRANASKNDRIESRQVQTAEKLQRAGLLSKAGLRKVRAAQRL